MRRVRPVPLTTRPRVSVVIPCYNYGRYLPDAVGSALDQSGVDVDVLIVDDCSTDDSAVVAQHLAEQDPRVDVLLHETNCGHIQTYNDGLAKVTGDYVVLLSADDLLTTDSLTRAVALMEAEPSVGLVYGWAQSFEGSPPLARDTVRSWSVWNGREWLSLAARRGRCFLSSPEAVMRREALTQTAGYDPRLPHSGDFALWLETAARWNIGRVNGPAQAFYRVHASNMHLTTYSGWLTDLVERRRALEVVFSERLAGQPALCTLRLAGLKSLAREALRRGLKARRDDPSVGDADLAAFRDFAVRTDPEVVHARAWKRAERRREGQLTLLAPIVRRAERGRSHLEWRRRRRYGT